MRTLVSAFIIAVLAACGQTSAKSNAVAVAGDSTAHLAHEAYTTAINSNNLDSLTEMFTEDVVFLAAHSPPIVGKPAVREWAKSYFDAFTTHWDKTNQEFKVAGDWAFERYSYKSTDTPKTGGTPIVDTGWGLLIYHHDADGKWRVARDAFSTEAALPTK